MAGILSGNTFPDHKVIAFWAVCSFSVIIFPAFYFNKKLVFLFILGLIFWSGYLLIQIKLIPDLPSNHICNYLDSKKILITGKVVSFAKHYEKKYTVTLLCRTIETKNNIKQKVTGKINLNIYGYAEKGPDKKGQNEKIPGYGDILLFKSSIKSIRNFMNPGAFDYEKFLKLKAIYGTAYTYQEKIKILTRPDQVGFFLRLIRKIERLRTNYYYFILNHTNRSNPGKILASLVTGKKEILCTDVRDLFSKAGISHLLAISGLHLSIVGTLFFYCFYQCLSVMPALLISGRSKKLAGILTLVPLMGYAIFSGFSPSTQRAFLMISVLLISFVCEKEKDIISSLSVAGILILLMDSSALFSISFQLSFIAVTFIICGVSLLKKNILFKKKSFVLKQNLFAKMGLMVCVSFFAGLGTLPLTAHYFNMASSISLLSNLIFIPVIGFIVLPLGLTSLVCFPYLPSFAVFIIHVCSTLVSFSITACEWLVRIPFSWSRTITFQWSEIAAIYLGIISVFFLLKGHRKSPVVLLVLSVVLVMANASNVSLKKPVPENLTITIIDVGQGNSALIQTLNGKNILVDGGGFSDISSFDTGRFIVAPFLWQKRIRSLYSVILTHPDSDHLNGLVFILQNFQVDTLIKNSDKRNSKKYTDLINTCKERNIRIFNPLTQGKYLDFGTARFIFYGSFQERFSDDFNNNSLVFKIAYNNFSMLFPGDILLQREKRLSMHNELDLHSDILLSPHHGSSTSSSKIFLDKVHPKSVIISCGRNNKYGFPHSMVLKRYEKQGIGIFRTDEDGAIFISSNGKDHNIKTYKGR
ncbi:DNA internalization-related competence protein ComEC/Rec2 [Desulfobacula phenolica]|uniref:Competence protein ComEC n=1 Tax=Desulfobacula phenolica TaxID=90732 RepID=A0A1H2EJY7_9BACT|nr:DNA internalization-related competence protein ComEC/Rec2 [Desulfobacula phenolica]SDT95058.1 competence protein ComEC [Desulfobacula phenolica]